MGQTLERAYIIKAMSATQSYAAVPHIVRIYREQGGDSWNTYAIVAIIELARTNGKNSDVPIELKDEIIFRPSAI